MANTLHVRLSLVVEPQLVWKFVVYSLFAFSLDDSHNTHSIFNTMSHRIWKQMIVFSELYSQTHAIYTNHRTITYYFINFFSVSTTIRGNEMSRTRSDLILHKYKQICNEVRQLTCVYSSHYIVLRVPSA